MELKDIKPTAAVTVETEDGKTLTFTVEHIGEAQASLDYLGLRRPSAVCAAMLVDAIVGWSLVRDDGTPWPCAIGPGAPDAPGTIKAADKRNLIEQIMAMSVKRMTGPDGAEVPDMKGFLLGLALGSFIRGEENFLKN